MSALLEDAAVESAALDAYSRLVVAAADILAPSVANLQVKARRGGGRVRVGGGSAVVLSDDGLLVTNAHVVAGLRALGLARASRTVATTRFRLVGRDPLSDLAVVRCDATGLVPRASRRRDVASASASSSSRSAIPTASPASVTAGVVSALGRSLAGAAAA